MSQMQTVGRKERSTVDNLIILNSIIEDQRQNKNKHIYSLQMPKKSCDKLWLKDCLIEIYYLGYSPGAIRHLYEYMKLTHQWKKNQA